MYGTNLSGALPPPSTSQALVIRACVASVPRPLIIHGALSWRVVPRLMVHVQTALNSFVVALCQLDLACAARETCGAKSWPQNRIVACRGIALPTLPWNLFHRE